MIKILIIIIIILVILIFIWYNQCKKPSQRINSNNENFLSDNLNTIEENEENISDNISDNTLVDSFMDKSINNDERLNEKFMTVNHARPGEYKYNDYIHGNRGGQAEEVMDYIDTSNDLIHCNKSNNDIKGNDENDGKYAKYQPDKNKVDKYKTSEIFNPNNLLPDENANNPDWFEIVSEPIDVKNRHLINISKPIGINTIGNSLRNPSHDIRVTPPNPKNIVSPWGQSTIEPDNNFKSLY